MRCSQMQACEEFWDYVMAFTYIKKFDVLLQLFGGIGKCCLAEISKSQFTV